MNQGQERKYTKKIEKSIQTQSSEDLKKGEKGVTL